MSRHTLYRHLKQEYYDVLQFSNYKKALMVPGSICEVKIHINTTAILIPKGHQLRLEISSSNFPKYPRNANTGVKETDATTFIKATQD